MTMSSESSDRFWIRRLILAGGFAVAVAAAPAVGAFAAPANPAPLASTGCTGGEEEDVYTTSCVPFMVPNSPSPFSTPLGNPDIPEVDGIPCTGDNSGQCIGLAESAEDDMPQVVPHSTISSSP